MTPNTSSLALFFAAALVIALTPGPGLFYVAARAVGLSALLMASAEAFAAAKLAGAAYLIWLGVKTIRQARIELPRNVVVTGAARAFREGVVVESLNPKTAAFFLAFIPQFVDPQQGAV